MLLGKVVTTVTISHMLDFIAILPSTERKSLTVIAGRDTWKIVIDAVNIGIITRIKY